MATDSPPLPNSIARAAALSDARVAREHATTALLEELRALAAAGRALLAAESDAESDDEIVAAFKRGVRWRERNNAPLPADAEIADRLRGRR